MSSRMNSEEVKVRDDGCICPETEGPPPPPPQDEGECRPKIATCPYDPRFPNQNQTKRCFYSFVDYQRCARLLGDYPGCFYFLRCYKSLCPLEWQDKWFEQMENNLFPQRIYPPKPIIHPEKKKICEDYEEEEEPTVDDSC